MPKAIAAQIVLDDAALARLAPAGAAADAKLLGDLRDLLVQVKDRLAAPLEPLLVNEAQAAELLGCSPRTVFELAAKGELHPVWLGENSKRYSVAELRELISRRQASPPAAPSPRARHRVAESSA